MFTVPAENNGLVLVFSPVRGSDERVSPLKCFGVFGRDPEVSWIKKGRKKKRIKADRDHSTPLPVFPFHPHSRLSSVFNTMAYLVSESLALPARSITKQHPHVCIRTSLNGKCGCGGVCFYSTSVA